MLLQRAWRQISAEPRRGEERERNRATARHNARCNREQKPNWRGRKGNGWRWKREDSNISITRSAWKRLTRRRARVSASFIKRRCTARMLQGHIWRISSRLLLDPLTPGASSSNPLPSSPPCAAQLQSDIYRFQLLSWLRLSGRECVSIVFLVGFEFKISFFSIDFIIKRIIRADRFWCKSKRIFKN